MTLENLEMLNDEELQAVITRAGELLKQHDRERKDNAVADARAILASAGLNLKTFAAKGRVINAANRAAHRRGHDYQHPTKVWNSKGQKSG